MTTARSGPSRACATTGARTWRWSLGVATAVAVLAGALLVGDSVRGSLRDLVLQRLGRTDRVVVSTGFFREALAADLQSDPGFRAAFAGVAPLIVMQGSSPSRRAGAARPRAGLRRRRSILAVSRRRTDVPARRTARRSSAARWRRTSARRTAAPCSCGSSARRRFRSSRCTARRKIRAHAAPDRARDPRRGAARRVLAPAAAGGRPRRVRAAAPAAAGPRARRRVNALLVSDEPAALAEDRTPLAADAARRSTRALEDYGLSLRAAGRTSAASRSRATPALIDAAAREARRTRRPSAPAWRRSRCSPTSPTRMRSGDREVPYSLVTAIDLPGDRAADGRPRAAGRLRRARSARSC